MDYIGKHVKRFESGTSGSKTLGSCGYDWGLSCGSYQLTLRWGNCINFLKKYFPKESANLYFNNRPDASSENSYFNNRPDISSKKWPGPAYCSSPEAVRSVWRTCIERVGEDVFFSYEHEYIKAAYYDQLAVCLKDYLDLHKLTDRALQECFWSWAIHRGVWGAFSEFREVMTENGYTKIPENHELIFDLIYDKRQQKSGANRYDRSSDSEREILRPYLTPYVHVEMKPMNAYGKIMTVGGTKIYDSPGLQSSIGVITFQTQVKLIAVSEDRRCYQLENGNYISTKNVKIEVEKDPSVYRVRVDMDYLEIKSEPDVGSDTVCTVRKNTAYTVVEEKDGFGRLQSGAGWITLDLNKITKIM